MTDLENKAQEYELFNHVSVGDRIQDEAISECIFDAYIAGAKEFLSMPLADRLTDEEKASLIEWRNNRIADIENATEKEAILYRGEINMLGFYSAMKCLNNEEMMENNTEYKNRRCCQHCGYVVNGPYCYRTEIPTQIDDLDNSREGYAMRAEAAIQELHKWCDAKRKKFANLEEWQMAYAFLMVQEWIDEQYKTIKQ